MSKSLRASMAGPQRAARLATKLALKDEAHPRPYPCRELGITYDQAADGSVSIVLEGSDNSELGSIACPGRFLNPHFLLLNGVQLLISRL
jgi:hypothetical protein